MSRRDSNASRLSSRKPRQGVPKSSSCDGLGMAVARFEKLCAKQWNFSPPNAIREVEEYQVDLSNVTVLELVIVPDISRGSARASLKSLRPS